MVNCKFHIISFTHQAPIVIFSTKVYKLLLCVSSTIAFLFNLAFMFKRVSFNLMSSTVFCFFCFYFFGVLFSVISSPLSNFFFIGNIPSLGAVNSLLSMSGGVSAIHLAFTLSISIVSSFLFCAYFFSVFLAIKQSSFLNRFLMAIVVSNRGRFLTFPTPTTQTVFIVGIISKIRYIFSNTASWTSFGFHTSDYIACC